MDQAAAADWRSGLGPAAGVVVAFAGLAGFSILFAYDRGDPHGSVAAMEGFFGWARAFHAWSTSAAVVLGVLALADARLRNGRLARDPRRWGLGLAMLGLLLLAILLGGLMPWDQQAWESLRHVETGLGWLGASWESPGEAPRAAVFWLHVIGVPIGLAAVAAWIVIRSRGAGIRAAVAPPLRLALPIVGLAAVLAAVAPPELGPRPIEGFAVSKPDWPFLWLVPFQDWLGGTWGLFVGAAVVGVPAVAAPWLGRDWSAGTRRLACLGFLGGVVALAVWGAT